LEKPGDELILELSSDIGNSQSARVIIPVCHIYLEHLMNLLIEKEYDEYVQFLSNWKNGFYEKLHKLCDLNLLSVDEHYDLEKINTIRNKFVHNFKPDLIPITKDISELRLSIYNEKMNPVKATLDTIITLMELLIQKINN